MDFFKSFRSETADLKGIAHSMYSLSRVVDLLQQHCQSFNTHPGFTTTWRIMPSAITAHYKLDL